MRRRRVSNAARHLQGRHALVAVGHAGRFLHRHHQIHRSPGIRAEALEYCLRYNSYRVAALRINDNVLHCIPSHARSPSC